MVRVGFVVEGDCEKMLLASKDFRHWATQQGLEICEPVINVRGGGNLCPENIETSIANCHNLANPDKIVVLTDLECDPCVTATKARIDHQKVDQIVVARKALEAWFMADTVAMRRWLDNEYFNEEAMPEETPDMPWDRLKEIGKNYHKARRGPGGTRKTFARKMLNSYGFSIERAANHPQCPSAKYFLEKLQAL